MRQKNQWQCLLPVILLLVSLSGCGGTGDSTNPNSLIPTDNPVQIPDPDDLSNELQHASIRTLVWPNDFPADIRAGLTDTILVNGLPTQTAYDFDVTLPSSVDSEDTKLFVLNLAEDQQSGGSVCTGDPDCTGTVIYNTVSLQLVSFDSGVASISISPSSEPALINEGSPEDPVRLTLSGDRQSYTGSVGAVTQTQNGLERGQSFYQLSGLETDSRYEVRLENQGDGETELTVSSEDGTSARCDPSYSRDSRCLFVASSETVALQADGIRGLDGAGFTIEVSKVADSTAFEGTWYKPIELSLPIEGLTYHFGRSDSYSSYYALTGLDPERRYRILLSGNTTPVFLRLNSPVTSTPVFAPQCSALDEDNPTGEQVCIIERAIYVYFRVESANESSRYLLSVEASLPDEGTLENPLALQLENQRLLHRGTVISNSFYKIEGLDIGQTYLLQALSEGLKLDISPTTSSSAEVDCNGSFHYDCVFTASEAEMNLSVADANAGIGKRYVLSVLATDTPTRVYPEPANEVKDLNSAMLPYNGQVGSYFSNYRVTGLAPDRRYLITLSDNTEWMSLSAWPGSSQTIQCRAYASHPLGTGCAGNTDSDGVINVRVGGDDAGGQFTIDVVEAQLSADYQSHDTRLPIADNSNPGAVSTISISDSETVEIVEVFLQIEHGYTEDLEVELEAPNGQRVMLANHVSDVELEQTLYSDLDVMANAERSDYGSQILRAYRPDGLLYNLNGIDKAGNWRLHVTDSVYSNRSDAMGGTLLGWGLRFRRLADYLRN